MAQKQFSIPYGSTAEFLNFSTDPPPPAGGLAAVLDAPGRALAAPPEAPQGASHEALLEASRRRPALSADLRAAEAAVEVVRRMAAFPELPQDQEVDLLGAGAPPPPLLP